MKIFNPSQSLILATTIFLAFVIPLRAQDSPQDFLAAHNRVRADHGVGPLRWDNNVANYALRYANQRKGDCAMVHSSGPYGENLAWSSGSFTAAAAVNMWAKEEANYDYNSNTCSGVCGHYTQVVWRNSQRLGCAKVKCNNGRTFITCNYDPPGNYVGEWPY